MAQFLAPLDVRQLQEPSGQYPSGLWELLSILCYESDWLSLHLSIPRGFVTDFASVPRLPFAYLLAGGIGNAAAVVHDYLYQTHLVLKTDADVLFREALGISHVPRWRVFLMYQTVKWFGRAAYRAGPERYKVFKMENDT